MLLCSILVLSDHAYTYVDMYTNRTNSIMMSGADSGSSPQLSRRTALAAAVGLPLMHPIAAGIHLHVACMT